MGEFDPLRATNLCHSMPVVIQTALCHHVADEHGDLATPRPSDRVGKRNRAGKSPWTAVRQCLPTVCGKAQAVV